MPFKKRRKIKNGKTKEKKAIATRLMVISLKMDDYIYKNKPISAQEAKIYIEEIATYKLQCINDVRSRQVIEKLTLFMKNIIKQNNLNNDPNQNIETDDNNINKSLSTISANTITNFDDVTQKNTLHRCSVDTIVNIENKNQVNTYIDEQNIIDTNSFSNLSINPYKENLNKDTFETKLSADPNNYGYSKENSLPTPNDIEVNSIAVAECNMNLIDLDNANTVLNINVFKNATVDITKDVTQNIPIDKGDNKRLTESVAGLNNIIVESLRDNNDASILEGHTQDKIEITTNKPNGKLKTKTVRTKKEVKTKDTNKDKKRPRKQTNSKKSCGDVPKKNTIRKNKKAHSKCCNIENETLTGTTLEKDIDVSWIENIKYVRDICKDEYDATLMNLEETFWNDLTLPDNWNCNDFDYTD